MEIIIGAVVFGLIVIAIIVMVIINFTYRSIKKRREDMEDDYYQHLKEKEQKEKHPFGKDYFKRNILSARTTSRVLRRRNNSRRPNLLISRQSRSRSSRSSPSNRNSLESRPLSKTSKKKPPVRQ